MFLKKKEYDLELMAILWIFDVMDTLRRTNLAQCEGPP